MRLVESGYVCDGRLGPAHRRSCAFTTAVLLQDGTVLVSGRWGSARDSLDGHECVFASPDLGRTWKLRWDGHGRGAWEETPGEVKGLAIAETAAGTLVGTGLWVDRSDPEQPFVHPQTQGLLPMRIFHTTSTDGGRTWGPRQRMDTAPHPAASPVSSGVRRLPGNVLAQPYEHWKEYSDPAPARPAAHLRLSRDDGATWPEYTPVAAHPQNHLYYWDQRLAAHPQTGRLVAMFWTHDSLARVDRDVHIAWGTAHGRSWSQPLSTGLPGQHCQPIALGGDHLLAVYSRRGHPPGIAASLSADFGRTWDRGRDLMVYDSAAGTEPGAGRSRSQAELWDDMEAWRFGHPRGVLLPGGEVLVVFYAGDDQVKSARWARLAIEA